MKGDLVDRFIVDRTDEPWYKSNKPAIKLKLITNYYYDNPSDKAGINEYNRAFAIDDNYELYIISDKNFCWLVKDNLDQIEKYDKTYQIYLDCLTEIRNIKLDTII